MHHKTKTIFKKATVSLMVWNLFCHAASAEYTMQGLAAKNICTYAHLRATLEKWYTAGIVLREFRWARWSKKEIIKLPPYAANVIEFMDSLANNHEGRQVFEAVNAVFYTCYGFDILKEAAKGELPLPTIEADVAKTTFYSNRARLAVLGVLHTDEYGIYTITNFGRDIFQGIQKVDKIIAEYENQEAPSPAGE